MVLSSICCLNSQYFSQNVVSRTTRTHLSSPLSPDLHSYDYHPISLTALNQVSANCFRQEYVKMDCQVFFANYPVLFYFCFYISIFNFYVLFLELGLFFDSTTFQRASLSSLHYVYPTSVVDWLLFKSRLHNQ